jgi:hypothetical protein
MTQTWCTPEPMLPAADAVPPPEAASPPVAAVKVKCVESGTLVIAKVPLYPATPMLVVVTSWPTTKPCALAVCIAAVAEAVEPPPDVASPDAPAI